VADGFTTADCFPGSGFVWAQAGSITYKKGAASLTVTVEVRYDSDGDCASTAADALLDAATVAFELRDGGGALVGSSNGKTSSGLYSTKTFKNVASGSYQDVVTWVTHKDVEWSAVLDAENPTTTAVP
jgi:hypothetical protein